MKDPLQAALEIATQRFLELVTARTEIDKKRAAIDAQIIQWKQLVDNLRAVCADDEDEEDPSDVEVSVMGVASGKQTVKFTDGVRMVLKEKRDAIVTPVDIRAGLQNLGFDFSKYSQPLTPIHNCLKRLEQQGEVRPEKTPGGHVVGYKWVSPIERALAEDTGYGDASGLYLFEAKRIAAETQLDAEGTVKRFMQEQEALKRAIDEQAQADAKAMASVVARHSTKKNKE